MTSALDLTALRRWLEQREPVTGALRATLLTGGRSNLTFLVADEDGGRWVLRRPPTGDVLESAHDMRRESTILTALEGTAVPVPRVIGFAEDLLNAPCYVMAHVDGRVVRERADAEELAPEARARAMDELVATLAALHALDPEAVGLGSLGSRSSYAARQLRRWYGQWQHQERARPVPLIDELHSVLVARIPEQTGTALVHGDYKLDNAIIGADGQLRAVLDWELATLGDPWADFASFLVYSTVPSTGPVAVMPTNVQAAGWPEREAMIARYESLAGRSVRDAGFYLALAYWKLAVIYDGVRWRAGRGGYGAAGEELARMADGVAQLAEAAAQSLAMESLT